MYPTSGQSAGSADVAHEMESMVEDYDEALPPGQTGTSNLQNASNRECAEVRLVDATKKNPSLNITQQEQRQESIKSGDQAWDRARARLAAKKQAKRQRSTNIMTRRNSSWKIS